MAEFEFSLEFDNPAAVFVVGQSVAGRVVVKNSNAPINAYGIRVAVLGYAKTHWEDVSYDKKRKLVEMYSSEEVYVAQRQTVWGNQDVQATTESALAPGEHKFAFSFQLPLTCASSFEGQWGQIRYICEATIEGRRKMENNRTFRPLSIVGIHDLNIDPMATSRVLEQTGKILETCCSAGHMLVQVKMPKRGFVSGEPMPFLLAVHNESKWNVVKVTAQLMQHTTFKGRLGQSIESVKGRSNHEKDIETPVHSRKQSKLCAEARRPGADIEPGQSEEWRHAFLVPPVPPTLTHIPIIHIEYHLVFTVTAVGPSSPVTTSIPVTIGTIPMKQNFSELRGQAGNAESSIPAFTQYPNMPLPLFSIGNQIPQNIGNGQQFAPLFPLYITNTSRATSIDF